jgi:KDO2-lipid IV(A) lauroyltransferase
MRPPTLEDRLEYLGVMAFVWVARILPARVAVWAGALLGRITFDVLRFRRAVTLANIETHLGRIGGAPGAVAIGRRAYAGFGRGIAEFSRLPCIDDDYIERHIETEGLDHLDRALEAGKGAVLVTGHFGSWELMGCVLVRLGYPLTFVVGVQRNRLVQNLMNRIRGVCGINVIEPTSLLATTRVLRNNRFIAMLSDQDAGRHGLFVDFLGAPASTPAGAARLALLTGAPVITGFIVGTGAMRHRIVIEEPVRIDRSLSKEECTRSITQAFTATIESYVRRYPDHWLWAHRRWKTKPDKSG